MHISSCVVSRCVLPTLAGMQLSRVLFSVLSHGSVVVGGGGGFLQCRCSCFAPCPKFPTLKSLFPIFLYSPFPIALICLAAVVVCTCTCARTHLRTHTRRSRVYTRPMVYTRAYTQCIVYSRIYIRPVAYTRSGVYYIPVLTQRESAAGLNNSIYLFEIAFPLNCADICAV